MKQKRKEKTMEDSIQDFQNIINKFQNIRRKIRMAQQRKMEIPTDPAEINRRYALYKAKLDEEKQAIRESKDLQKKLDFIIEYQEFETWKPVQEKRSIIQRIKSKLKGGDN